MKAWRCIVLALVVGALAAGLTQRFMASRQGAVAHPPARRQPAAGALIVTSQPALRSFARQVGWIGTVQSQSSVQLIALAAGRVEAIEAQDQAPVRPETVVMRLGGARIKSRQTRMRAAIDVLKSRLALSEEAIDRLGQDLKDQLATKNQLATAQEARLKFQGQMRDAELALRSFNAQLAITAGVAGVFTNRRVSVGQAVEVGQVVGEVIDPIHLRIVASLFPPAGAALKGKEATVGLGLDRMVRGVVEHVLPRMGHTGATEVWIEGPQIDGRLKPGRTVSGMVTVQTAPSALSAPASAIVYDSRERPYVFVREDGTYRRRDVQLGLTRDGWVQVLSGLKPGESVVTRGAYELYYRQFSRQFKVED